MEQAVATIEQGKVDAEAIAGWRKDDEKISFDEFATLIAQIATRGQDAVAKYMADGLCAGVATLERNHQTRVTYGRNNDKMQSYVKGFLRKHANVAEQYKKAVELSEELDKGSENYEHSVFASLVAACSTWDMRNKSCIVPASMGKSFIVLLTALWFRQNGE